ncbi:MAG: ATP-binding cassette domain-containing protein [Planctomycetes bacterium]|nr:ATP-binding cassette domain-containing protein [Planctomycetota bacterium]
MLTVRDLHKRYGDLQALNGVSFDVRAGDVVGFLGPNGAGKSTTMKIVTGYIPATSGSVTIDGLDTTRYPIECKRRLGYLPESTPLYGDMRVREYLTFRARLKGVARRDVASRVDYVMERTWLGDRARQLIRTLSKGYRQRVGIADALVSSPKLLILDEPTIGLDPNQIRQVRELIKELGQSHTILLSTHILAEVEMVCDRVIIVARGKIAADDTVEGLVEKHRSNALWVSLRTPDELDKLEKALRALPGVLSADAPPRQEPREGVHRLRLTYDRARAADEVAEQVARVASEMGWPLQELAPERTTLEQIFHRLTQGQQEVAA